MVPKSSLLWAFITLRHINLSFPLGKSLRVLEIGPGSGFFSILARLSGYSYKGFEITEAFYLHQHFLWKHFFGDSLNDLAFNKTQLSGDHSGITHIPFWKFHNSNFDLFDLNLDAIVMVDVICEMQIFAFRYLGRQASHWLTRSSSESMLFVQGTGAQHRNRIEDVIGALHTMGLPLRYSDKMSLPPKYAPHDMFFWFSPATNKCAIDAIKVDAGRKRFLENAKIDSRQVNEWLLSNFSLVDLKTDDEKFWDFCNGYEWKWY